MILMKNKSVSAPMNNPRPESGVVCVPTSVIVKHVGEPKSVTESIFQSVKQLQPPEPRAVTEVLFSPMTAATEEVEAKPTGENSDNFRKENVPDDEFIEELFSNLEQLEDNLELLAPHAGNNCISLSQPHTPTSDDVNDLIVFDKKLEPTEDKPGDFLLNPGDNLMWANYETPEKKHCSEGAEAGPAVLPFIRETRDRWNTNDDSGVIKIIFQDLDEPPEQDILSCFQNELTNLFFG